VSAATAQLSVSVHRNWLVKLIAAGVPLPLRAPATRPPISGGGSKGFRVRFILEGSLRPKRPPAFLRKHDIPRGCRRTNPQRRMSEHRGKTDIPPALGSGLRRWLASLELKRPRRAKPWRLLSDSLIGCADRSNSRGIIGIDRSSPSPLPRLNAGEHLCNHSQPALKMPYILGIVASP
jgi:hypothetical protein